MAPPPKSGNPGLRPRHWEEISEASSLVFSGFFREISRVNPLKQLGFSLQKGFGDCHIVMGVLPIAGWFISMGKSQSNSWMMTGTPISGNLHMEA
jgi:hypothetical protein